MLSPAGILHVKLFGQLELYEHLLLHCGTAVGLGVAVGVAVGVAQTQLDSPVQDVFLQLPVLCPAGMLQVRLLGQLELDVQL
jgi:hypothetical protein